MSTTEEPKNTELTPSVEEPQKPPARKSELTPQELLKRGRTVFLIFREDPYFVRDETGSRKTVHPQREIKIFPDGTIAFDGIEDVPEAARFFWDQVCVLNPALVGNSEEVDRFKLEILELEQRINILDKKYRDCQEANLELAVSLGAKNQEFDGLSRELQKEKTNFSREKGKLEVQISELEREKQVLSEQVNFLETGLYGSQMEELVVQLRDLTDRGNFIDRFFPKENEEPEGETEESSHE